MEEIVTDFASLPGIAKVKRQENEAFRNFLKPYPADVVEAELQPIVQEVTARVDCTKCGNCCRNLEPGISVEEAGLLAKSKGISKEIFLRDFTSIEPETGVLFMNHQPCIFFDGSLCTIYENRPASCADFPHLVKGNFKFRFHSIMANYAICPIVFNSVEGLKHEMGFSMATK